MQARDGRRGVGPRLVGDGEEGSQLAIERRQHRRLSFRPGARAGFGERRRLDAAGAQPLGIADDHGVAIDRGRDAMPGFDPEIGHILTVDRAAQQVPLGGSKLAGELAQGLGQIMFRTVLGSR